MTHFFEGERGHLQHTIIAGRLIALEEQINRSGMREFRRASKSAISRVKLAEDGFDLAADGAGIEIAARTCKCFRVLHRFREAGGGVFDFSAPILEPGSHGLKNPAEAWPSHGVVGRKICPAEKWASIRE